MLFATHAVLFATQAADSTGSKIRTIIFGLLAVAMLLTGLTIWYWRHTDPRKRLRDSRLVDQPAQVTSAMPAVPVAQRPDATLMDDDGADEWLRLTGPDALHRR